MTHFTVHTSSSSHTTLWPGCPVAIADARFDRVGLIVFGQTLGLTERVAKVADGLLVALINALTFSKTAILLFDAANVRPKQKGKVLANNSQNVDVVNGSGLYAEQRPRNSCRLRQTFRKKGTRTSEGI